MVSAEEEVANIMQKCGFIDTLWESINVSDKISILEEMARKNRPPIAKPTEPLTKFLLPQQAKELQNLRNRRLQLKEKEDKTFSCATQQIKERKITLIKTKKGIFAEKHLRLPVIKKAMEKRL